jgi:hypothetical protein
VFFVLPKRRFQGQILVQHGSLGGGEIQYGEVGRGSFSFTIAILGPAITRFDTGRPRRALLFTELVIWMPDCPRMSI